jgi:cytochrome c oxidase assembly protein subunit 15
VTALWHRIPASLPLVRRLALASLVANIGIVVTGGGVRLTGSGLGCPTFPRCTEDSWVPTPEMGLHGVIEFGNRTLTFVLGMVALAGLLVAWRLHQRPTLRWWALAVLVGIAAQGGIGGITVLTQLNPWIVGSHFMVSVALIATAYGFWHRTGESDGPAMPTVPAPLRTLLWVLVVSTVALLAVGTVVTGSGPHAGDEHVARNGLDPQALSQAHADLAFLVLGLAVAVWFALRAVDGPAAAVRAAAWLVGLLLAQGVIGMVQYFTGLPELLVALHLLGSCLTWVAVVALMFTTRTRSPEPIHESPQPAAALAHSR